MVLVVVAPACVCSAAAVQQALVAVSVPCARGVERGRVLAEDGVSSVIVVCRKLAPQVHMHQVAADCPA